MTDESGWSPPGGEPVRSFASPEASVAPPSASPPAPSAVPFSPPVAPPTGMPQGGQGQQPGQQGFPQSAAEWTPPPKPGLIPLRPLDYGTILGAPYRVLRRNPRPTFGTSLLLQGGVVLVSTLVIGLAAYLSFSRIPFAENPSDEDELVAGAIAITALSALVPVALSIFTAGVLQGVIVLEVARESVGEKLRFGQLWRLARGRLLAVGWYSLLITVAGGVVLVVLVGVVFLLTLAGPAGIAAGVLLAIFAGLGLIVASAWLSGKLAFVPSIIVLERATVRAAIARSWRLTNRAFWKVFGTVLLVAVIINFATQIIVYPLQLVASLGVGVLAPTGDPNLLIALTIGATLLTLIATLVLTAIAVVVQSATTALLYLDQRMRKEGLDLELARYVEQKQTRGADVADPFAPPASTTPVPTPTPVPLPPIPPTQVP